MGCIRPGGQPRFLGRIGNWVCRQAGWSHLEQVGVRFKMQLHLECKGCKVMNPGFELTCVGDAAVLGPPPGMVDDDHPDERRAHHTAHDSYNDDSHGGPAVTVRSRAAHCAQPGATLCPRVAVGVRHDGQPDVPPLGAECIGHLACVRPRVSIGRVNDDEELIGCREKVPLGHHQRAVVFGPVELRGRTATGDTLQHGGFALGHGAIHKGPQKGRCFCGGVS